MKSPRILMIVLSGLMLSAPAGIARAVTAKPDAEVLGLLQTIDQNEIMSSQRATEKNVDPKVARYAKMLHEEHSKNLEKEMQLSAKTGIQPLSTQAVEDLRDKGTEQLSKISALEGAEFASAYILAMVKDHAEALTLIDSKMGSIQNPDLRDLAAQTREHVAKHLQEAQKVKNEVVKP